MAELKSWNSDLKTWKIRNEFLLKSEIMSDCTFHVIEGDKKTIIPAHKYVLGGNSAEFYNLFYLMKSSDEIPIEDTSADIFTKFLEFLYTEKTTVTMENIENLLSLARRYSVKHFEAYCGDFLSKNVIQSSVLSVMDKYSEYEMPSLMDKCAKLISNDQNIFKNPSFLKINIRTLTELLKSEELIGFEEITIVNAVNDWAENFCKENNQKINSENKRLAVKPALKYMRFASMPLKDFATCTVNNSFLTSAESLQVVQFFGSNGQMECDFSSKKREIKIEKKNSIQIFTLNVSGRLVRHLSFNKYEVFTISVNKPIYIYGFGIFGRCSFLGAQLHIQNPENFTIQLKNNAGAVLVEGFQEIRFFDDQTRTYELRFERSILLNPSTTYTVYIHRQIPSTFIHYCSEPSNITKDFNGIRFNINNVSGLCKSIIFSE